MIELTEKQMQVFDGLMISDAYLRKNKGENGNGRFCLTTSKREFAEKVMQIFSNFPWSEKSLRTFDRYDKRTEKSHSSTILRSLSDSFFTNQYHRWYPNGKKIVPKDIEVDKEMLLWWYIGDGCLIRKKARPKWRRANLATNSFDPVEVFNLIDKLKLFFNEDDNIYEEQNKIMISRNAFCCFASLFENSCPVDEYKYKFDFGQYLDKNYLKNSYKTRPIHFINKFRKKNKVRELDFRSKKDIRKVV